MPRATHLPLPKSLATRSLPAAVFLGVAWMAAVCVAQQPVSFVAPTALTAAATSPIDQRDLVLLLESGPLHLRLRISLGGVPLGQFRDQYVTQLLASLDQDGDGRINRTEAGRSPLLRTKQRPGAAKFLEGVYAQTQLQRRDLQQMVDRLGGETIAFRQDLTSAKNDIEVFKLLDADTSGTLSSAEAELAADLILAKDMDADECVSFDEFFPPPPQPAIVNVRPMPTAAASPTVADLVRDAREPLLARRLIRKYDRNRDEQLDQTELTWQPERLARCDANHNGMLDAAELAALSAAEPDLELSVNLGLPEKEGGRIEVMHCGGLRLDDAGRNDFAKVGVASAVITLSLRDSDPFAVAISSAMRQFNLLDADANGYLERDETALRLRFERGLFDLIDADADGKLFVDEMQEYVRARCEPAAASSRMNVYDTGYGFSMAPDGNADGRVSLREMRQASAVLAQLDRDGQPGIGQSEPVRHFHVEFVRGGYQLFGPSEQAVSQTPGFQQRRPTGPIWFQRMDRNNDGDLTWNEFLGPREVFHELDADADALIDPREAAAAK